MNWTYKIRAKLGAFKLQKTLSSLKRKPAFINFDKAREVGIIVDGALDVQEIKQVVGFIDKLKKMGKSVSVLGYWPKKDTPENPFKTNGLKYFSKQEVGYNLIPKGIEVERFLDKDFDVVIGINTEASFPLLWVSALTKAHLRVSKYNHENTPYFDLMIKQTESEGMKSYFDQILHYLGIINKQNA